MGVQIKYSQKIEEENLDTVFITGGGFVNKPFKGISRDSAWGRDEVVWAANLSRSSSFAMTNIDNVRIGSVANVELTFPLMSMQDFIDLQKILHERHCIVNYFSVDDGKRHTKEMAVTTNERKTLYSFGTSVIGMQNVKVTFVATNRKIDEDSDYKIGVDINIKYNPNGGNGSVITDSKEFSEQYVMRGLNTFTKSGYHIKEWNTKQDGSGARYLPNQSVTICEELNLYAIWE